MKRLKLAFALFIVILLFVMGFMLFQNFGLLHRDDGAKEYEGSGADLSMTNPHFLELEGDRKLFELRADEAHYFKDGGAANLLNPRAVYYGREGKNVHIAGREGLIDTDKNDVTIEGEVRLTSDEGYLIESEEIKYIDGDAAVTSDKDVRVRGAGFDIKGTGMKYYIETGKYSIAQNVEAYFETTTQDNTISGEKN